MERYKTLLKDTAIFAIGNLGSKLILFFMVPLYTNYMTTEEYGISDLVFTIAQLIIPFSSLVIFDAVQRFGLSKNENSAEVLLAGLFVCVCGGAAILILTPLMRFYAAISEWRWYLSMYVIINMFGSTEMNYLKTIDRNRLYAALSILQTALLAGCNVLFLCWSKMGVRGYLLSTCLSSLVPVIMPFALGGLLHVVRSAKLSSDLLKRMVGYSAPLILNNVSWWAIHSFDKIVLEAMIGAAALGVYTVATKIPSLVNVMTSIFSQAWGISSVREYESENDTHYYSTVLQALECFVFGATMLIVTLSRPFMNLYVGRSFSDAWRFVPLLLVSASFYSIGSFYGSMYGALKKSVNNMLTTVLSAVICVLLTVLTIPSIGVWGAVAGTYAAYLILMIARIIDVGRLIDIDLGGSRFWISVALLTIHAVALSLPNTNGASISAVLLFAFVAINRKVIVQLFAKIHSTRF